ncbi:hypothetical protein ACDX66_19455 [Peribacillus frigoritolerans]
MAWQSVGGKGADLRNQLNYSNKKLQANLIFNEFVYSLNEW